MAIRGARRQQRGFAVRQRPTTNWARTVSAGPVVIPAASKVLFLTFVLNNPAIGEVIRRTRGRFMAQSDQSSAAELQLGAWGVVVAGDRALIAGAASLPGPVTDRNDDGWLLWEGILQQSISTDGATATALAIPRVFDYDSKAMRRIEEGFGLAVMVENSSATFDFEFFISMSLLSSRIG